MSRFFCSDCTILRFFSGHGSRDGPVLIRGFPRNDYYLSVYLYGTIIAKQYIYSTYNLLFLFLNAAGDSPSWRLKNVPKWDWFWKPSWSAICCMGIGVETRSVLARCMSARSINELAVIPSVCLMVLAT